MWERPPSRSELAEHVAAFRELFADVKEGEEYVYFDGAIIPAEATGIEFEGLYARHNLPFVPQQEAVRDRSVVTRILSSGRYWAEHRIESD